VQAGCQVDSAVLHRAGDNVVNSGAAECAACIVGEGKVAHAGVKFIFDKRATLGGRGVDIDGILAAAIVGTKR